MTSIDDLLFSETDGACAYCGNKDYHVLTIHHIIQREPKDESYDNKLLLCHNCHALYHQQQGPSEDELRSIKKRLILKTLTQQGANALKEAFRKGIVVASPYLVNHLREMRLLESWETISSFEDGTMSTDTSVIYKLTDIGREFIVKWNLG